MNRRRIIEILQRPLHLALRSSRRGEGPVAPLAPNFRANTPHPVARGGVRRGLTTPADCATIQANLRHKSRPPFLRPLPIAALVIGLLQSGAAFTALLTAPAGGVDLPRRGERAQAIRDVKLYGASTLSVACASHAGRGGFSMPATAERAFVLCEAGNHSTGSAPA